MNAVACPFCEGHGRIQAETARDIPEGWVTLPVLAARVGLSHATVHKHIRLGLLRTESGEYQRGNRKYVCHFVTRKVREQYEALIRERRTKQERPYTVKMNRMIDAKQPAEVIAAEFGIKVASARRAIRRRAKHEGEGK